MEPLADVGHRATKRISPKNHRAHPEDSTRNVKRDITRVGHQRRPGHRRAKRPDDRDEARKNHRASPIFLIELLSPLQMAAPEKKRILPSIQRGPGLAPNPVAELI